MGGPMPVALHTVGCSLLAVSALRVGCALKAVGQWGVGQVSHRLCAVEHSWASTSASLFKCDVVLLLRGLRLVESGRSQESCCFS